MIDAYLVGTDFASTPMSTSPLDDSGATAPRPPNQVQFFTRHYHLLKGLCYAPVGGVLLLGILGMLLVRPGWVASSDIPGLFALGLLAASAPWMWYMHRRYEAAYGRVRQSEGGRGARSGLIGQPSFSFLTFGPLLLFGLCWIAVTMVYIPERTPIQDEHYPVIMGGWLLFLGGLRAPFARLRWIYGLSGALLFGVTLLPLVTENVILVQALNYGLLGTIVAGMGLYHHRLLVDVLGPLTAGERHVQ